MLNRGEIPIYEPGLEELVRRNRAEKRLSFTTDLPDAVRRSPRSSSSPSARRPARTASADLQHVLGAARDIARAMNGYKVIVDKSTVPAGHVRAGARGDSDARPRIRSASSAIPSS